MAVPNFKSVLFESVPSLDAGRKISYMDSEWRIERE